MVGLCFFVLRVGQVLDSGGFHLCFVFSHCSCSILSFLCSFHICTMVVVVGGGSGICFLVLYPSSVVTYYCLLLWTRFIMGRGNFYFPNIVSILGRLACLGLRNEASSVFLAYPFSQCLLNSDLWVIGPWIENSFLPVPRSSTLLLIPVQDPESKSFPCFFPGPEDLCF